jgi:hypothetical protein
MNYTSGNKAPTQMAQMPNRKGNVAKHTPKGNTGVTANTGLNKRQVSQPSGAQGAPKAGGTVHGTCSCPLSVSKPKSSYGANDGYRNSSYLK